MTSPTPSDSASSASEGRESLRQVPSHDENSGFLKKMRRKSKKLSLLMFK
jgi:hypothetical protein